MVRALQTKLWTRIGIGVAVVLMATAGYFAWNWSSMANGRLAKQVRAGGPEESRLAAARKLVAAKDSGREEVKEILRTGDPESCAILSVALHESLDDTSREDPYSTMTIAFLLDLYPRCSEPGQLAIGELFPTMLKRSNPKFTAKIRELVQAGLTQSSAEIARRCVRWAMRPEMILKAEIVPALHHNDAAVRKEAMLAVGPASVGMQVLGDEELFHWLHDADAEVRLVCEAALGTRGLEPEQIRAAWKLTSPDAADRLSLLVELRQGTQSLGEPGPWLERLGRDAEPAVRAGAARVACERKVPFASWVKRLAVEDPDAGVRQVADFHRGQSDVQQTVFNGD